MTARKSESLEYVLQYGIDIKNRTILLKGAINEDTSMDFLSKLLFLSRTEGDIQVILNSGGGDVVQGLAIHDSIKLCSCPVSILCYGDVQSIAAVILQASKSRVCHPTTQFMMHYGTLHPPKTDSHDNIEALTVNSKHLNDIMRDIYLNRIFEKSPNFQRRKLHELLNKDTYLSATEALALGLIDKILTYPES